VEVKKPTVKTLSKGQIGIPADIRKKHHIVPGTEMQIMDFGGVICLIPPVGDPVKAACGVLPARPSLAGRLLKERKDDFK